MLDKIRSLAVNPQIAYLAGCAVGFAGAFLIMKQLDTRRTVAAVVTEVSTARTVKPPCPCQSAPEPDPKLVPLHVVTEETSDGE